MSARGRDDYPSIEVIALAPGDFDVPAPTRTRPETLCGVPVLVTPIGHKEDVSMKTFSITHTTAETAGGVHKVDLDAESYAVDANAALLTVIDESGDEVFVIPLDRLISMSIAKQMST